MFDIHEDISESSINPLYKDNFITTTVGVCFGLKTHIRYLRAAGK